MNEILLCSSNHQNERNKQTATNSFGSQLFTTFVRSFVRSNAADGFMYGGLSINHNEPAKTNMNNECLIYLWFTETTCVQWGQKIWSFLNIKLYANDDYCYIWHTIYSETGLMRDVWWIFINVEFVFLLPWI